MTIEIYFRGETPETAHLGGPQPMEHQTLRTGGTGDTVIKRFIPIPNLNKLECFYVTSFFLATLICGGRGYLSEAHFSDPL